MKIKFLGAARTVTGSCYIIQTDQTRFAIDCGMHQGPERIEARNRDVSPYDPAAIDFIIITHAHIDHSGLLPLIVKSGFRGPIYATEPTRELVKILLLDSAHVQQIDTTAKNRRLQRAGRPADQTPL